MPSFKADDPPITMSTDGRDPWERQPDETAKRYEQFCVYRNPGPGRTLTKTAETLTLSAAYVRSVSAHFLWSTRAQAWDREQDRIFSVRVTAERQRAAMQQLALGAKMFQKVRDRLETIDVQKLTAQQVARLAEVGLKLQQSGLGMPDSTVQVIGDPTQPVAHHDVSGMSLAERRALLDSTLAELERRRGVGVHQDEPDGDGE